LTFISRLALHLEWSDWT